MIAAFVILTYVVLSLITLQRLKTIHLVSLNFSDGILVGFVFYMMIPLIFIFINGDIYSPGIFAPPYNPYEDIFTTLNIFLGWMIILLVHFISKNQKVIIYTHSERVIKSYFRIMLVLYVLLSSIGLLQTGILSGDFNWHDSLVTSFSDNTLAIIFKNFSNAFRTMLFGGFIYIYLAGLISKKKLLVMCSAIVVFDVITTFNRITILYFFILLFIVYIKNWKKNLLFTVILIPIVASLSNFWAAFRATNRGFSLDSFSLAYQLVGNMDKVEIPLIVQVNAIFESSNIVVLNWVVKNVGDSFEPLWGWTYFLRPLTTFMPSTIWAGKPKVFGSYLGSWINHHPTLVLNSTAFGEVIANFYFFWPVIFFVVLLILGKVFRLLSIKIPGAEAWSFFVAIALWRFDINFISICIISIALVYFVRNILYGLLSNRALHY